MKAIVHASSDDDMWLAYGTTAHPSKASVTPAAAASNDVYLTVVKSANRSTAEVGESIVYTIQYNCVSTIAAGQTVTITDVLDPFLTVTGLTNSAHIASSNYDTGTNTVSFNFVDPLPAGSTGEVAITAEFIPGVVDNYDAPNTATMNVANGAQVSSGTVTVTSEVSGGDPGPTDPTYVEGVSLDKKAAGSSIRAFPGATMAYSISHGNSGDVTQDLDNYIIQDDFPPEMKLMRFNVGEFPGTNQTITVSYETSAAPGWIVWPGGTWNTDGDDNYVYPSELGLAAGTYVTGLRFDFGTLPGGAGFHHELGNAIDIGLELVDPASLSPGDTITNCANLTATEAGGPDAYNELACADITVQAAAAGYTFGKSAQSGELIVPGGKAEFNIHHGNHGDPGEDIADYVVEDVFPVELKLWRFSVGEFHGTTQTVSIEYMELGSSTWIPWPAGVRNTDNDDAYIYASELGLPALSHVAGLRLNFGTLPGGAGFGPGNNDPIDIDLEPVDEASLVIGTTITNCANFSGNAGAYDEDSCDDVLVVEAERGVSVNKWATSSNLELPYEYARFDIRHGNVGDPGMDVENYVLTDVFPLDLKLHRFNVGEFHGTSQTVDVYYQEAGSPTWVLWPGGPWNTNNDDSYVYPSSLGLASGSYVSALRFNFGTLPGGGDFSPSNNDPIDIDLSVVDPATIVVGSRPNNCATLTAGDVGGPDSYSESSCDDLLIKEPDAEYRWNLYDATGTAPYDRWEIVRMGIRLGNDWDNGIPLVNPILAVLLPEGFIFQPGTEAVTGSAYTDNGSPTYTLEVIEDFDGNNRDLVRFTWTNFTIPANGQNKDMWVEFDTEIGQEAPFIDHTAVLYGSWDSPADGDGTGGSTEVDTADYDGDGNTTERVARDYRGFDVENPATGVASLDSVMGVKGELDSAFSAFPDSGLTVPSGRADYELRITNSGESALKDLTIIEILPFVGDTGVIDLSDRNSEWSPFLVGAVEAPYGMDVFYSTSGNPCRDELTPGLPAGCDPPAWTSSLPADTTTVKSMKFVYRENHLLLPGEEVLIAWPMRAPINAPTNGEIAWSSFGVVGTRADNDQTMLPSEPMKVGIGIQPPQPPFYGDTVWLDSNRDGVQDANELGINGVRVELYTDNGDGIADPTVDTMYSFTVTSNDGTDDGKYLFPYVPPADYFTVFYMPADHLPSPPDATSDDLDSDGLATTLGGQSVTITPVTTIEILEIDLSWDQGVYDQSALPAVWAIANIGGSGSVVIGGKFQSSHGVPCGNIAVLGPNGVPSGGFNSGTGFDGIVRTIAVTDDGKILVGGDFSSYDGKPANGLALLDGDGGWVNGLAMPNVNDVRWVGASGSSFYIAGGFSSLGGQAAPSIGRLNSDGSVDTSFQPGAGADGPIHCAAVSGGGLIVGGSFSSYGGSPAAGLARIHADGSHDTGFDIGSGFDGPVNSITSKGGMIFATGDFSKCNDHPTNGTARLGPGGAVDISYDGGSSLSVQSNRASQ